MAIPRNEEWLFLFPETLNIFMLYEEFKMSIKNLKSVNEESKDISTSSEAEVQTTPVIINNSEPEPESWSYMGIDSTEIIDVTLLAPAAEDDEDKNAVDGWLGQITKPKKGQKFPKEKLIGQGIELAQKISAAANREINLAHQYFAYRAIIIGRICLNLKELIKGFDKPWGSWAEENLPFIAKRNREKYMLIASRQDCHPFTFLGVDRLEMLCSVTKKMDGEDRIGDLFRKYEIPFNDEMEMNLNEFKTMIDAAINNEKLVRNGLTINFNMVANVVNIGVDFDKALIRRLKEIDDCGGNPETLLQKIALTGGREDNEPTAEKRLQDFNHLANRLLVTLDFLEKDQDQLVKIDRETFTKLIDKLVSIQELSNQDADKEMTA